MKHVLDLEHDGQGAQERDHALVAYEALAPAYDLLAADYCHERWLEAVEAHALRLGLRGRRVLDVACGTGRSFLPLLERGYEVVACDLSPSMVERARRAAGDAARVFVADMRRLGRIGEFDLLTCLDDAVNYLLTEDEVVEAFRGFHDNLAPAGLAVWDVNTLHMHRTAFASDWVRDAGDVLIAWKGRTPADLRAGQLAEATVDVFTAVGEGWQRSSGLHRQRHWPAGRLRALAEQAGLRVLAVLGQHAGARLEPAGDETVHRKLLFIARRADIDEGR
jgi:SAM-dependent methyltransferase